MTGLIDYLEFCSEVKRLYIGLLAKFLEYVLIDVLTELFDTIKRWQKF